jgi:hypothetical protein
VRGRAGGPLLVCLLALGLVFGCGVDQLVGLDTAEFDGGVRDGGRRDGGGEDGDGGDNARACLAVPNDGGLSACPSFPALSGPQAF